MKKVAVLMGGKSGEREISLKTGNAVLKALNTKKYKTKGIDTKKNFISELIDFNPDIVFIALHGPHGEDGTIQGLLEVLQIPYCGCGVMASALAINKIYSKKILKYENIPTADFKVINITEYEKDKEKINKEIIAQIKIPLVVKAPSQGSTIGIYFVKDESRLEKSIEEAFKFENEILVESFIDGKEVTVAVVGNENPVALPIIEIVSHTGVYDYEAKYTKGLSEHIIPANLDEDTQRYIKKLAIKTYKALGCKDFSRVDFMIDENKKPYVLEINTIPGMTETSLLPDAASAAGINFPDLIDYFIKMANGEEIKLDLI